MDLSVLLLLVEAAQRINNEKKNNIRHLKGCIQFLLLYTTLGAGSGVVGRFFVVLNNRSESDSG